jgi:hypothetical protein
METIYLFLILPPLLVASSFDSRYFIASNAALQPDPAAFIACLFIFKPK